METLGVWLRQTREAKGSTLGEAEAATRIKARLLEALEAGDFASFPGGEVQVRGFLHIYARYLGLSPDEVLARYDAEVHGVEATVATGASAGTQLAPPAHPATNSVPFQPRDIPLSASRPRWLGVGTVLLVGIVLVATFAVLGRDVLAPRKEAPTTTVTPQGEATLPAPTETPVQPIATPTSPLAGPERRVKLILAATEHVWVRVTSDGETTFEGLMTPGQVETWLGQEVVAVDTGNGAGLVVTVNGQSQGVMGERGQLCARAWGPTGEVASP